MKLGPWPPEVLHGVLRTPYMSGTYQFSPTRGFQVVIAID